MRVLSGYEDMFATASNQSLERVEAGVIAPEYWKCHYCKSLHTMDELRCTRCGGERRDPVVYAGASQATIRYIDG